jgi:hypothetical protein
MPTRYRSKDGREWRVTLEDPALALGGPPTVPKSGGLPPQEGVRIVFTSGDMQYSEEYFGLSEPEDLSPEELDEWFEAAKRGKGV